MTKDTSGSAMVEYALIAAALAVCFVGLFLGLAIALRSTDNVLNKELIVVPHSLRSAP